MRLERSTAETQLSIMIALDLLSLVIDATTLYSRTSRLTEISLIP